MPKKTTPAERFAAIFELFIRGATPGERATAERKLNAWLNRHGKTHSDIPSILAQAAADKAASQPPPPPSDPRDSAPNPFEDPQFTPVGLVDGLVAKYVTMPDHVRFIFALWICFTHVYPRFAIAPRVALTSEEPHSGKTVAKDIARHLVFRPNPEDLGTGAAIADFLDQQGVCTILLDELDHVDKDGRRRLNQIWNLGHKRGAKTSMMVRGRRKLLSIHAPMLAAGIGSFLAPTQKSRTFTLEMEQFTAETKPEREYNTEDDFSDFDAVYTFLHHWAAGAKLNPKPSMPSAMLHRVADNARGLLSIADSCGPTWGQRAREALTALFEKEKAERPHITIVRHGLAIFDMLEVDQIGTVQFNRELKRLDLPDAKWTRYRGASGMDYPRPLEMHEQSTLLRRVGIHSIRIRQPGAKQRRGYKLGQFTEATHRRGPRPRLRVIAFGSD
jgi:Protein of unknown function (DUF3631)